MDMKNYKSKYLKEFINKKCEFKKCSKYCPLECNSIRKRIDNYFPNSSEISNKDHNQNMV